MADSIISQKICSVDECSGKHFGKGYCKKHYTRFSRHGDPIYRVRIAPGEKIAWLKSHVDHRGDECLSFPFSPSSKGYGEVVIDGRGHRAANGMLRLCVGPPPTDKHQCAHSCGNGHKGCVNPNHLRWATAQENADDKLMHGTQARGSRQGIAKLAEDDVIDIRARAGKISGKALAREYGVTPATISCIILRKSWAWL